MWLGGNEVGTRTPVLPPSVVRSGVLMAVGIDPRSSRPTLYHDVTPVGRRHGLLILHGSLTVDDFAPKAQYPYAPPRPSRGLRTGTPSFGATAPNRTAPAPRWRRAGPRRRTSQAPRWRPCSARRCSPQCRRSTACRRPEAQQVVQRRAVEGVGADLAQDGLIVRRRERVDDLPAPVWASTASRAASRSSTTTTLNPCSSSATTVASSVSSSGSAGEAFGCFGRAHCWSSLVRPIASDRG